MLLDDMDEDVVVVLDIVDDDEADHIVVLDVMLPLIEVVDDEEAVDFILEGLDETDVLEYLYWDTLVVVDIR